MFLNTCKSLFLSIHTLGILLISALFLFPAVSSAAVLYQNDFATDPEWMTDDPDSFYWDESVGALSVRVKNGPRGAEVDRYFAIPTQLDPTQSFTLSWRQMIASSTSFVGVPFGILPESLVTASSTGFIDGVIQGLYGLYWGRPSYESFVVYNKFSVDDSQGGIGGFNHSLQRWYKGMIAYDAEVGQLIYSLTDTTTNVEIFRTERNNSSVLKFGPSMRYIGLSMYAISGNGTISSQYPDDIAEAFIDDVKLETIEPEDPEAIIPVLSLSSSRPYDGVRSVSPEKGIPNETVFTFAVRYTHGDNIAPTTIKVVTALKDVPMTPDMSASSSLRDGDYRNGEAYVATTTFDIDESKSYLFSASYGTATATLSTTTPITLGFSNIAFLPGVKSTYLYREGAVFEDQLWLPNPGIGGNDDVSHLYMNSDGTSAENGIYTKEGDIIKNAYAVLPIYKGFPEAMDELVSEGTIAAWKPISYDWRLDYEYIISSGKKTGDMISYLEATDTPYVYDELRKLADSSLSGKVTIIAHSNGGLLAKAILVDLEARHDPLLEKIDLVVLVAVPQLGTPKALFPTLHGAENELMGKPTWISDSHMRRAAQYMPTALNLLPSEKYFTSTANLGYGQIVKFSSTLGALSETIRYRDQLGYVGGAISSVFDYRTRYGNDIGSYAELVEYLQGAEGRQTPAFADVENPVRLEQNLLAKTHNVHQVQDSWTPPDLNNDSIPDVRVVQIAGDGLGTIRGIEYITKKNVSACQAGTGNCTVFSGVHADPIFGTRGDETVILPSATAMLTETYYVNLKAYNESQIDSSGVKVRNHANMMAAKPILQILDALVRRTPNVDVAYVTETVPPPSDLIVIEMHSPVALDVYDGNGGHLGSTTDTTTGISYIESTIPNATYFTVGESTYITLDPSKTHTVKLDGLGTGTFTLKVKKYLGNTLTGTTTYSDVPVTAALRGQFTIGSSAHIPSLPLDINGDGTVDKTVVPDGTIVVTPQLLLKDFRVAIAPMVMPAVVKSSLVLLSQTTEQLITAKKISLAKLSLMGMELIIKEKTNKGILKNDANTLLAILTTLKALLK